MKLSQAQPRMILSMKRYVLSNYARLAWPALATVFLLVLAWAWLLPGPATVPRHLPAMLPPAMPNTANAIVSQWDSTALARPLFSPGRRPSDQPGGAADAALPRLTAIIITGGTRIAVFAADGAKPQAISPGGTIAGYVLNRISPDHIELGSPGGTLTLHPQFAAAAISIAPPAAPPAKPPTKPDHPPPPIISPLGGGGPIPGQTTNPVLNPANNPAIMIEQNF